MRTNGHQPDPAAGALARVYQLLIERAERAAAENTAANVQMFDSASGAEGAVPESNTVVNNEPRSRR